MSLRPEHLLIKQPIIFDNSIIKTEVLEVCPANGTNQANLNSANAQLRFVLNSENRFLYLASDKTGFRIKVGFITKAAGANNMNAKCTLVSNWANHLFATAKFILCGTTIETIDNLGVATDILYNLRATDFRLHGGELEGFVPDTGSGNPPDILSYTPTFADAAVGNAAGIVGAVSNKGLARNANYNSGFERRLRLYNYTVADNDTVRYAEVFIPLKSIFSFCDEYNKVMKYVNFEIQLVRQNENQRIYFGANNTSLAFGDPQTTGLLNIVLEIETVTPNPQLAVELDNDFKEPIHVAFLERTCINRVAGQTIQWDMSESRFTAPRYAFVVNYQGNRNLYRHSDVNLIQIIIDGEVIPNFPQDCKFLENTYKRFYQQLKDVCKYFDTGCSISTDEFKDLYTIYALDLSAQNDKIKGTNSNLSIRIKRNAIPANNNDPCNPQNTEWFILILQETHLRLNVLSGQVETILV